MTRAILLALICIALASPAVAARVKLPARATLGLGTECTRASRTDRPPDGQALQGRARSRSGRERQGGDRKLGPSAPWQ
jgi:hypothetical protein